MTSRILHLAATFAPIRRLTRAFLKDRAIIFMAHRFAGSEPANFGHDPAVLDKALAQLREDGAVILPLWDLIQKGMSGEDVSGIVAFTVDDGYSDFYHVAAPIFRKYDCPVTLFPVTGFLDGGSWLWWDRIRYVLTRTSHSSVALEINGEKRTLQWSDVSSRLRAVRSIRRELAKVQGLAREAVQSEMEAVLEVPVPDTPSSEFSPLTWDQARELGRSGVSFGPHTVDHPNLALVSESEAEQQIGESWARVKAETETSIPVFCFPYGALWSLAPKLRGLLRECGLEAAVTAEEGHVSAKELRGNPFHLPRIGWPDTYPEVVKFVSGFSRAKEVLLPKI
jgi:peptidoglycan/xylan/chitin deacetylase (PgdA/CDA1 family)